MNIGTPRANASRNATKLRQQSRQQLGLEGIREDYEWTPDDWGTPPALVAQLAERWGPFDLDPCAVAETAKAPNFYAPSDDGLAQRWHGRVFLNPPYSAMGAWLAKAVAETGDTGDALLVCALIPAHTDRAWWHDYVERYAYSLEFLRGRVRFTRMDGGPAASPTFGSAVAVFTDSDDGWPRTHAWGKAQP